MKIFKNTETKTAVVICAAGALLSAAFAFVLVGAVGGLLVLLTSAFVSAVFAIVTEYRYKKLEKMSEKIDSILHSQDNVQLGEFCEGELAVLTDKVSKLTKRFREYSDALEKDKLFLADSMADISHQLRTPLTSVNILLSSLAKKDMDTDEKLQKVCELRRLVLRIDRLIDALLKISRIDAGAVKFEKERVSVKELVALASEPLYAAMDIRNQTIVTKLEDCFFDGDINWSAEAIGNILKNCMEHNKEGGRIFVSAKRTNIYTEIVIADEGNGISDKDLPNLFKRFYKGSDNISGGFGIGLCLAKMIVSMQNGIIKAKNRDVGGAEFTVRFYYGVV